MRECIIYSNNSHERIGIEIEDSFLIRAKEQNKHFSTQAVHSAKLSLLMPLVSLNFSGKKHGHASRYGMHVPIN